MANRGSFHEQRDVLQIVSLACSGGARIEPERRQQRGLCASGAECCSQSRHTSARYFRASLAHASTDDRRGPSALDRANGCSVRDPPAVNRTEHDDFGDTPTVNRTEHDAARDTATFNGAEQ